MTASQWSKCYIRACSHWKMWARSYIQTWDWPYIKSRPTASTIILRRTHFFSNIGSNLHTRMSVCKYVGISGSSPLLICNCIPTTLFDITSLGQDYLHEVVSIQGLAHIADEGWAHLFQVPTMKICGLDPTTLHQTCHWEHALSLKYTLKSLTTSTRNYRILCYQKKSMCNLDIVIRISCDIPPITEIGWFWILWQTVC